MLLLKQKGSQVNNESPVYVSEMDDCYIGMCNGMPRKYFKDEWESVKVENSDHHLHRETLVLDIAEIR